MSRIGPILAGSAFVLIGLGFLAIPAPPDASKAPIYGIIAFCWVMGCAFIFPRSRPVTVRLIAAAVTVMCAWYLIAAIRRPPGRSEPSLFNAIAVAVCFGLPAVVVALSGVMPRLGGRQSPATSNSSAAEARPRLLTLSLRPLPDDAKILMEGIALEQSEWQAIHREVNLRRQDHRPRLFRRIVAQAGMWLILVGGILAVSALQWPSITIAGAIAAAIVWCILWLTVGVTKGRAIRREVMSERGHPICVECGYNLLGLAADKPCPECGWRRKA